MLSTNAETPPPFLPSRAPNFFLTTSTFSYRAYRSSLPPHISLTDGLWEMIIRYLNTHDQKKLRFVRKRMSELVAPVLFEYFTFSSINSRRFPDKLIKFVKGVKFNALFFGDDLGAVQDFMKFIKRLKPSQLTSLSLHPFPTSSKPILWPLLTSLKNSLENLALSIGEKDKFFTTSYDDVGYYKNNAFDRKWVSSQLVDGDTFWPRLRKIEITIRNHISENDFLTLKIFSERAPNIVTYNLYFNDNPNFKIYLFPKSVAHIRITKINLSKLIALLDYLPNLQTLKFTFIDDGFDGFAGRTYPRIKSIAANIKSRCREGFRNLEMWQALFPNAAIELLHDNTRRGSC